MVLVPVDVVGKPQVVLGSLIDTDSNARSVTVLVRFNVPLGLKMSTVIVCVALTVLKNVSN